MEKRERGVVGEQGFEEKGQRERQGKQTTGWREKHTEKTTQPKTGTHVSRITVN